MHQYTTPQLLMITTVLAIAFPAIFLTILGSFVWGVVLGVGAVIIVLTLFLLLDEYS